MLSVIHFCVKIQQSNQLTLQYFITQFSLMNQVDIKNLGLRSQ